MNTKILSTDTIHNLNHTFFDPELPVKATLLVVHGMTEHSARYSEFASFLADQGVAVATYDHLGHGKSVHNADELGYFGEKNPEQIILQDVMRMSQALQEKYKHLKSTPIPHFVMGHSMGSFVVRNVLKHHAGSFDGAILMGTSDKDPLVKLLLPIMGFFNKQAPHHRPELVSNLMSRVLNLKVKDTSKSPIAWISKCTANINRYEADPLCGFCFTNNGYHTLFKLMNDAVNKNWYANLEKDFPIFVVSGKDDPVGNMGKGIDTLVKRLEMAGYKRVEKKLYEDMRHEPLNESGARKVYNDIFQWIDSKSELAI